MILALLSPSLQVSQAGDVLVVIHYIFPIPYYSATTANSKHVYTPLICLLSSTYINQEALFVHTSHSTLSLGLLCQANGMEAELFLLFMMILLLLRVTTTTTTTLRKPDGKVRGWDIIKIRKFPSIRKKFAEQSQLLLCFHQIQS